MKGSSFFPLKVDPFSEGHILHKHADFFCGRVFFSKNLHGFCAVSKLRYCTKNTQVFREKKTHAPPKKPACFLCKICPSEKGSTCKGKNELPFIWTP